MRKKSNSVSVGRSLEVLASSNDVPITDYLDRPSHRRKKLNQYIRGERVGKGRHGEVYIGQDTLHDHRDVAIKIVKRSNPKDKIKLLRRNYQQTDGSTKQALNSTENSIRREIAVMKHLRHPNLASLLEVIDDPREEKIYLIMEYIAGGTVEWSETINHAPLLSLAQTRRVMRDVILGLEYLHCIGIVHRDVKPSNIMYTADRGSVKLIDFGISHITLPPPPKKEKDDPIDPDLRELFCPSDLRKRVGTPSFLAPEVVWFSDDPSSSKDRVSFETIPTASSHAGSETVVVVQTFPMPKARPPITPAIDVWSLGVTFYCLLFGHTPFNGSSSENQTEFMLYHQICTQDWRPEERMGADQVPTCGRHPADQSSEGFSVMQLLEGMLQKHPKDRISLNQVKCHPFILQDVSNSKEWLKLTTPVTPFPDCVSRWKRAARILASVLKG